MALHIVINEDILKVDNQRKRDFEGVKSGIFVRAYDPEINNFISADILWLEKESLKNWLKSLSPESLINLILYILGHEFEK